MNAFILLHQPDYHNKQFYDICVNYTKLYFDHSFIERVGSEKFVFIETNDITVSNNYDFSIIAKPGYLLSYPYYESNLKDDKGKILATDLNIPHVDYNNFVETHSVITNELLSASNRCYIIHNEIPNIKKATIGKIKWAATVSSGFFINYILDVHDFEDNAIINHVDISKPSLQVRKYTIDNWNGKNYLQWMDHLYEKFPLMESFNGKLRLRSTYPAAIRIWKHVEETFKNNWIEHWNRYKNCKHNYIPCNLASNDIDKLFKSKPKENSVFWWNGALKHLPANVLKTSNDSHKMSINFIQKINNYNSELITYGSDFCSMYFNGITASKALNNVKEYNSRDFLWKLM
jgi:hypothetical protein|tara:strand:+ start:572 stop:1609 length:1038 start_codon:yes stop_codon:yes gene_type:complete